MIAARANEFSEVAERRWNLLHPGRRTCVGVADGHVRVPVQIQSRIAPQKGLLAVVSLFLTIPELDVWIGLDWMGSL